ncbi:MAG TPA: carbohydrate-binding protein [Tepidisphaeraceae bacterium]|nr:carbohydrate-binding protein [Tepidisphaeraceae bacterium]
MAKKLHKEKPVTAEAWQPVHQRLVEMAAKAGVGAPPATVPQAPYDPSASLQAPLPWRLPRVVEFEHYDVGGPGVSFSDTDEENQGKHYRKDAVDVKASSKAGNGAVVGFTQAGEWMEYTVSVADAGSYALSVMYATPDPGRRIQLSLGGDKPLVSPIQFAPTAGWDDLKTMQAGTVTLPAGDSVIRVTVESGPVDLDYMEFKAAN